MNGSLELDLDDLLLESVIQGKYEIMGGLIYVHGNVHLGDRNLIAIPWKFGRVSGNFFCSYNKLQTLEGAPTSVGGSFYCRHNQLRTLIGAPSSVGHSFYCQNNPLTTLEGAPTFVGKEFVSPACACGDLLYP
jgi:hypothetical protein